MYKRVFLLAEMALAEVAEAETENSPDLMQLFTLLFSLLEAKTNLSRKSYNVNRP